MNYLVTGATGGFGTAALKSLQALVPQEIIYALARSAEKAADLKAAGFNVRLADYDQPAELNTAFAGIDRLLFVSGAPGNRQQEHQNVVDAAKAAGVSYIAYTSFADAQNSVSVLAADHAYTEKAIEAAGIPHTFLRNNWYLENELPLIGAALQSGEFVQAGGAGKTGWALRREYAEVGAKAIAGSDYPEILELSGTPVTYQTLVTAVEEATGKTLAVKDANQKDFEASLVAAGLPAPVAEIFYGFQADIKAGVLDVTSADFAKALGRPLTSLTDGVKELLQ